MENCEFIRKNVRYIVVALGVFGLAACTTTPTVTGTKVQSIQTAGQCAQRGFAPPSGLSSAEATRYVGIAEACAQRSTTSSDIDAATAAFNAAMVYNAVAPILDDRGHYDRALSAMQRSYAVLDDRDSTLRQTTGDAGQANRLFIFGRKLEHAKALASVGVTNTAGNRLSCGTVQTCTTGAISLLDAAELSHAAPIRGDGQARPGHSYNDYIFLRAEARNQLVGLGRIDQGDAATLDYREVISSARGSANVGLANRASVRLGALSVMLGNKLIASGSSGNRSSYEGAITKFSEAIRVTSGLSGGDDIAANALLGLGNSYGGLAERQTGTEKLGSLCQASASYERAKAAATGLGWNEQSLQASAGRGRSLAIMSREGLGNCPATNPAQPQSVAARRGQAIAAFTEADSLLGTADLLLFADLFQAQGNGEKAAELIRRVGSSTAPGGLDVLLRQAELSQNTNEKMAILQRAARDYAASPKPHVKLGELYFRSGDMPEASSAFYRAANLAQDTSMYSAERSAAQFHLSQIKSRQALQLGTGRQTSQYRRLVEEAATRGEEAARLSTAENIRQQACRAHLLNRASQISRTQADLRCGAGATVEDGLLNALYKLRRGQFHTPLSDTIGAFGPAEEAFREARARHSGALTIRLPAEWGLGDISPTYGQVFEHGVLIANLCSRRGQEGARPPSGDLAQREAVFKLYGLFGCQP